ncbi:SDR family NAD(P)-dependent oxidoreductase [Flammeovirgaceae bacterium SG7u.111]|nr:SDR family NAD(P)-dependent oxidoreductase [Flammeovirgaceae bacterium SG7u.132]WPO37234.1 SDR family NAD(P)-dependent oxidoreductase [Flammeovirgaceae bacterium SG7u.111]
MKKTIEALGCLDILINNADSLVARTILDEMETEFWHKVMDINLTSMMFVTRAAATTASIPIQRAGNAADVAREQLFT